jgi:hypothetical protein
MTILQQPRQTGDGHAATGWYKFGHGDEAVRETDAWEHETFAEEQARWERSDPAYARICEEVRHAKKTGGEASLRADQAKAAWDARVATQRQADDDAQRAHHASEADRTAGSRTARSRTVSSQRRKSRPLRSAWTPRFVIRAREGHHHLDTTFAIECNDSPAPGIIPEPVRVHDERAAKPAADRPRRRPSWRGQVSIRLAKLMSTIRGDNYMVDAYPPAWHSNATTQDRDELVGTHHNGPLPRSVRSAAPREAIKAERAKMAELQPKKR